MMETSERPIIDDDDLYLAEDGSYEYQGKPFTGTARLRARNGVVVSEINYVDGLLHGLARYWYPSGEPRGEEHFEGNGRTGPSREWYPTGQLKRETAFEYSVRVRERQWNEAGELMEDYVLTEDQPVFRTLQKLRRMYGGSGSR
jgi:antitoxin component YwqK of YwqJK toxin-antitoxin module